MQQRFVVAAACFFICNHVRHDGGGDVGDVALAGRIPHNSRNSCPSL